jgi:cytochrome c oxidase subunit 2
MTRNDRSRRLVTAGLTAAAVLALAACGSSSANYPHSTFEHTTEFNTAIDALWDKLLFWGTLVFVLVEALLVYTIWRFRKREGVVAKHVHGNTTLVIMWTVIPVFILAVIAVPTVRTIFRTQAKAAPNALQVEVIGHQWWWEFRYPQYGFTTANEVYLPVGRTVNFKLTTADVLHSFWIPRLGGKRDLIANHVNYLWFTPDSAVMGDSVLSGFCTEYCGASHANMRIRAFTVSQAEFEKWAAHQKTPAAYGAIAPGAPPGPAASVGQPAAADSAAADSAAAAAGAQPAPSPAIAPTLAYAFPGNVPSYAVPKTPIPSGLTFPDNLQGDPARGRDLYSRSACIGCHVIEGNPMSRGVVGPNLTHVGSRLTIGSGMYANDARHLALWIKNTRAMKPGSQMPTLGKGQRDPITKQTVSMGGLDDQQIADIVAYLMALK